MYFISLNRSQLTPPSVEGLKALCAIGLLRSDQALTSAVVQELLKLEDPEREHLVDITWLTAAELITKVSYILLYVTNFSHLLWGISSSHKPLIVSSVLSRC